jgi:hypothetical protein
MCYLEMPPPKKTPPRKRKKVQQEEEEEDEEDVEEDEEAESQLSETESISSRGRRRIPRRRFDDVEGYADEPRIRIVKN